MTEQQNFLVIEAYKLFGQLFCLGAKSSEFTIRPLTDTASRSIDGLDKQSKNIIANPVLKNRSEERRVGKE